MVRKFNLHNKIKGYSKMRKSEIIDAMVKHSVGFPKQNSAKKKLDKISGIVDDLDALFNKKPKKAAPKSQPKDEPDTMKRMRADFDNFLGRDTSKLSYKSKKTKPDFNDLSEEEKMKYLKLIMK